MDRFLIIRSILDKWQALLSICPHYGPRSYSYKTLESWLCNYNKHGIEGLVRGGYRSDKGGKSRKISPELGEEIVNRRKEIQEFQLTLLYEQLVSEGKIEPKMYQDLLYTVH